MESFIGHGRSKEPAKMIIAEFLNGPSQKPVLLAKGSHLQVSTKPSNKMDEMKWICGLPQQLVFCKWLQSFD